MLLARILFLTVLSIVLSACTNLLCAGMSPTMFAPKTMSWFTANIVEAQRVQLCWEPPVGVEFLDSSHEYADS